MNPLSLPETSLTADQRRLLGGWRDVLDDVRRLSRRLLAVPGECRCGDRAGHLRGSCPCCRAAATDLEPSCHDCEELLAQLRSMLDGLTVDTMRARRWM
jgi:hypothetical protein